MMMTRRQFLKRVGYAMAGALVLPNLFDNPLVRNAFADTIGDRYLVNLFLDGGNDGLNTIIPMDDSAGLRSAYESARLTGNGGLRIEPGEMFVPTVPMNDPGSGTQLGFHPGLSGLGELYNAGNIAVIQGTGYPDYSLSHESSRVIWQTANPLGLMTIANSGWMGRHLGLEYDPQDIFGVTINNSVATEMKTTDTSVLAIRRLNRFGFPIDDYNENDETIYTESFNDLYTSASGSDQSLVNLIGNTGSATYTSTQSYPLLHDNYINDRGGFNSAYSALRTSMAYDLREIAKIIYGVSSGEPGVSARFFQCRNGGYDTHADQGNADPNGRHYNLLAEVADAISLFFQDLNDMGVGSKVILVVWSEFSRRIPQNNDGTDHGSQGPMFVIGQSVNGGIYGNHPNIDPLALDRRENTVYSQATNDDFRSTDFRDVFGTVLKRWVNMDEADILSDVLPIDVLTPAANYWTVQNFDMGFLS